MKKTKQEKGITLVALIITVILLLILSVVSIRAVQDDGVIFHAKKSAKTYGSAQLAERMKMLEYEYEIQKAREETTTSKADYILEKIYGDKVKIGTKVAYDSGVDGYSEEWAVLGVENGQLMLLSQSVGTLQLSGQDGYNNGVQLLDDMAAAYGNGAGAVSARSIRVEDINNVTGYNPGKISLTGKPYGAGKINEYGNSVTFEIKNGLVVKTGTNGATNNGEGMPTTFRKLNGEALVSNSEEKYTVTNSYYDYRFDFKSRPSEVLSNGSVRMEVSEDIAKFLIEFDGKLNSNEKCWLANQSVLAVEKSASWGLMHYSNDNWGSTVARDFLYNSNVTAGSNQNGIGTYTNHVRVVVYLEAGIELTDTNNDGVYEI